MARQGVSAQSGFLLPNHRRVLLEAPVLFMPYAVGRQIRESSLISRYARFRTLIMPEIDLLDRYPKSKRPVSERSMASPEDRALSIKFGKEYFDGTRQQGYGGYVYNGWFKPVVQRFIEHYGLSNKSAILDVGCAKGFMMHD